MPTSYPYQQPELLTSWKEIAAHLGKGVRTVQRWEEAYGLPVRRPNEKSKGIVHATRAELDQWLATQWSQRPKEVSYDFARTSHSWRHEVRENLQQASALRQANRRLSHDVRSIVDLMAEECKAMARSVNCEFPLPLAKRCA